MRISRWTAVLLVPTIFATVGLPLASAQKATPLADSLNSFVSHGVLAGAVMLVASKDRVLAVETIGWADLSRGMPMGEKKLFWIASMSKPITATALMMLVDEGKVKLDDPVEKYLPEFHDQWLAVEQDKQHVLLRKPARPITVRAILSHTSGMPFKSALEQPTLDLLPLKVAVRSYAITPLVFEPGSKYQYSNAGINTVGRIIEVVSGMPYEQFLDKRLFEPLGMKDTTFWPNQEQQHRLVTSYKSNADKTGLEVITVTQLKYPLDDRTRQPMPAGGLFSTAHDLGRFCQMILNGGVFEGKRLLSTDAVKQMTRKQTGPAVKEGYGLGWSTGGDTFGHGGAYSTQMWVDTKNGLVMVLLVQHAGFLPGYGDQINDAFLKAARKTFAR
ncbi:MAG TPA: serine hydrolase domain-containing protein [Gemmataceae bacterium]|nr:serine hydrolase domain-containing protein [Gemmataceae bacterium]